MSATVRVRRHLRRLLTDLRGDDVIEYSLLTLAFGIIGVVVWSLIGSDLQTALVGWDGNMQGLWDVPNPGGP